MEKIHENMLFLCFHVYSLEYMYMYVRVDVPVVM